MMCIQSTIFTFFLYYISLSSCNQIPKDIFPIKYHVTVAPYFESELDSHFDAELFFTFKPIQNNSVKNIVLHADGLNIHSFELLAENGTAKERLEVKSELDRENQLVSFQTEHLLSLDLLYELRITYSGNISEDGWGLYKGFYTDEKNEKRFFAVTQLRPVFARRLLPCLDEPMYKARFTLQVYRLPQYTARSNMPVAFTSPKSVTTGRVLDTFVETPPMSTFLLALVVFDFSSITSPGVPFSSWAVPSKVHLANYGHSLIPALVKAMENVTDRTFPLPKLDQIALPNLNPVAMENWGMNTYREVFMFYKEGEFAPRVRQDVPRFTAHEISHHWLGNLVTLEWWSWLWLSEMYAMYYEYYLPSQVNPLWRMEDQMVVDLILPGLLDDSFTSSIPLTTNVSSNQEILNKFSGLAYTKGPALVRMVSSFMSRSRADKALRKLLNERQYKTVNPTQLWHIYDKEAEGLPTDMMTIMKTWTDLPGYPLVTAYVNQSDDCIILRQERFVVEGNVSERGTGWWVPLSFTTGSKPDFNKTTPQIWLHPEASVTIARVGQPLNSWVIFNLQHTAFYRVNYDDKNWESLIDVLRSDPAVIHDLNRAQLLDDSFSLARAGRLPYSVPLRLVSYLTREACYFPIAAVIPHINFLMARLNGHSAYDSFRDYMRQLVAPVYDSVGFHLRATDSHLTQLNRVQVVTLACSLGVQACVQAAQQLEQDKPSRVPPGLETVQLCTVLEAGVAAEDMRYQLSDWSEEDQLRALPCTAKRTLVERYLKRSLEEDSVATWQAKLNAVGNKLTNVDTVLSFLVENHQHLLSRFGATEVAIDIMQVGKMLSTPSHLNQLDTLRSRIKDTEILSALSSTYEVLIERLKWTESYASKIEDWILSNKENVTRNIGSVVNC